MATTVYTYNDKVLKNVATDKWLKKPEPAGFVMNASNATYTQTGASIITVLWQSPTYPNAYNGNGKQYILVNNNSTQANAGQMMYATTSSNGGPKAVNSDDMKKLGTSTGVLMNNPNVAGDFGILFAWPINGTSIEEIQAYIANVTITILDP